MTCDCGAQTHRDDAMNSRCNGCERLVRQCICINPNQHCTAEECPFTQSHTAKWCGYTQVRQCDCHWDYPVRGQVSR